MTFKTNLPATSCPALSGFSVLDLQGADAAAFLQAQTMNDVALLVPGQWQWNGWLTPKGRLVALFALLRLAPDRFLAVLPDFPAAELQSRLQRFVFRSKVTLGATGTHVAATGPVQSLPDPDRALALGPDAVALDFGGEGGARTLYLLPADSPALAPARDDLDQAWLAADLAHGLPRLPAEGVEAWTPQMLSLGRLAAFSLRKGCYPGQEIVARTHYLGQAKRELVGLDGAGLQPGQSVEGASGPVGQLVCVSADGHHGLAVVSVEAPDALAVNGEPCRRSTLLGGLARPR